MKERLSLMESANKELMVAILPTLDDFERAITELKKNEEHEAQLQGVYLIYNKLNSTVTQKGLAKVAVEKGDVFNAEIHEAITQITAPTEDLKGKIIDVIENGYKLGEKIIRFPKVIVGA
jgi:molecular chaperone GrpE